MASDPTSKSLVLSKDSEVTPSSFNSPEQDHTSPDEPANTFPPATRSRRSPPQAPSDPEDSAPPPCYGTILRVQQAGHTAQSLTDPRFRSQRTAGGSETPPVYSPAIEHKAESIPSPTASEQLRDRRQRILDSVRLFQPKDGSKAQPVTQRAKRLETQYLADGTEQPPSFVQHYSHGMSARLGYVPRPADAHVEGGTVDPSRLYPIKIEENPKQIDLFPTALWEDQERYRRYKIAEIAYLNGEAEVLDAPVGNRPVQMPDGRVVLYVAKAGEYRPGSNEERYYARSIDSMEMTKARYEQYVARDLSSPGKL